jgi:hypothetical protein
VKSAAKVHFGQHAIEIAFQFVPILPHLLMSNYGSQKLAVAFQCLSSLLTGFPSNSPVPIYFFWPALLAAGHSSTTLRRAGLSLLSEVLALVFGSSNDFGAVRRSRSLSPAILNSVGIFEEAMGVSFEATFSFAFVSVLTRAVAEVDTRVVTLKLFEMCLRGLSAQPLTAVDFALPFVAFGQDDCGWILPLVGNCSSLADFVIGRINEQRPADRSAIIGYLAEMYGDRHCAHRIEQIAACLVLGCEKHGESFGWLKKPMVEKCWKMIDAETNPARIRTIAKVAACFYAIPAGRAPARRSAGSRMDDNGLGSCIGGTVQGIADLLRAHAT